MIESNDLKIILLWLLLRFWSRSATGYHHIDHTWELFSHGPQFVFITRLPISLATIMKGNQVNHLY